MNESSSIKLDNFKKSILAESRADVKSVLDTLETKWDDAVEKADKSLRAEAERYKNARIAELRAREGRRVAAHMTENKRTLLQYREECASEAFALAREKIHEFVQSEEYPVHLAKLLKQAVDQLGYGFAADVYLRPEDMHLADYLLESVTGVSLGFRESDFDMGGLRLVCTARGRRVDMSFGAAMQDLVGHFSELANMQVED